MVRTDTNPSDVSALRQHDLIVTIFGLYARSRNGAFAVSELIQLLSDLGVEPATVRSSISRLKRRGVLVSLKSGRAASYRLDPGLEDVFRAGDDRIFSPHPTGEGVDWILTSFSVPESQRHLRYRLRAILTRIGCGQVSPGLWIAPGNLALEIGQQLERAELTDYVDLFQGAHLSQEHIRAKVAQWWDLSALEAQYSGFIDRYLQIAEAWSVETSHDSGPESFRRAFADYVPMVTQWRRLQYLDPGLPDDYLPDSWRRREAEGLFLGLHGLLETRAKSYAQSIISS